MHSKTVNNFFGLYKNNHKSCKRTTHSLNNYIITLQTMAKVTAPRTPHNKEGLVFPLYFRIKKVLSYEGFKAVIAIIT